MDKALSILLVGVGGQGTILASKVLAEVAQMQGYDVKMTEKSMAWLSAEAAWSRRCAWAPGFSLP